MKIGIVGGGIVGSVTAYYLGCNGHQVTLFDIDKGQATRAAVGIVCPWVSQRRNKAWYRLASEGAAFYHKLNEYLPSHIYYRQNGTVIEHPRLLDKLYNIARERAVNTAAMGTVELLDVSTFKAIMPASLISNRALWISGGAQVDGEALIKTLHDNTPGLVITKQEIVMHGEAKPELNGQLFDAVVLACGAWLPSALPNYNVAITPQKGQLMEFECNLPKDHTYPVYMPQGEIDFLYGTSGRLIVGASHETGRDDCIRDDDVLKSMINEASSFMPSILNQEIAGTRIGIRGITPDFSPFYGKLTDNVYVAGGLGSSGLTTGPLMGYRIAQAIMGNEIELGNPQDYISKK